MTTKQPLIVSLICLVKNEVKQNQRQQKLENKFIKKLTKKPLLDDIHQILHGKYY